MVTYSAIGGAEPSTLTFKVNTVLIGMGSTNEHREVQVLGDPQTSNAVTRVLAAAPASTEFGLVVRIAGGPSSAVDLQFRPVFSSTSADNPVSATQVGTWNIATVTTVTGATISGFAAGMMSSAVLAGNSSALNVRPVWSSTNADQPVSASLNLGGLQSSAVPTAGSSALLVRLVGAKADNLITVYQSSKAELLATIYQSSAAELQATVTPAAGSTWKVGPGDTNWASSAGFHFDSSGALNVAASFTGSTGPLTVSQLLDSSGGSISAGDSANNALRVNVVAGAAGGSTIVTVSTVQGAVIVRSSAANALVTVYQSTKTELLATIYQSTRTELLATVYQSTASEFQATVTPAAGSTFNVRPLQSSAADLQVTATIGTNLQSTIAGSSNSSGLLVRPIIDLPLTAASTTMFAASTLFAVNSTVTGAKCKVFGYSFTSTAAGPTTIRFYKGSSMIWTLALAAVSSAISGANLMVSPPAYMFATAAGSSMTVRINGSTIAGIRGSVAYFMGP